MVTTDSSNDPKFLGHLHHDNWFGKKTIGLFAGVALLVNNITGPGVPSLPNMFAEAGEHPLYSHVWSCPQTCARAQDHAEFCIPQYARMGILRTSRLIPTRALRISRWEPHKKPLLIACTRAREHTNTCAHPRAD